MELLTTLTLAHLLADFPLQTNTIATYKANSFVALLIHVLIHMVVTWGLLGFYLDNLILVCLVGGSHLIVDWLKPRLLQTDAMRAFIIDQSAHLFCLVLAAQLVPIWLPGLQFGSMPALLLYPSLLLGFTFGGMVMVWLWANSRSNDVINCSLLCKYGHNHLLELEQRLGFALVCLISISIFWGGN